MSYPPCLQQMNIGGTSTLFYFPRNNMCIETRSSGVASILILPCTSSCFSRSYYNCARSVSKVVSNLLEISLRLVIIFFSSQSRQFSAKFEQKADNEESRPTPIISCKFANCSISIKLFSEQSKSCQHQRPPASRRCCAVLSFSHFTEKTLEAPLDTHV